MKRIVRATFANGATEERRSVKKIYTHAYLITGVFDAPAENFAGSRIKPGTVWGHSGFSTSEYQCDRNMHTESAWARKQPGSRVTFQQVVAVEVVKEQG